MNRSISNYRGQKKGMGIISTRVLLFFIGLGVASTELRAETFSLLETASLSAATITAGINHGLELNAGTKRKKKKRQQRRTYTRRGNPEVTRRVATELIVNRLPELARLVNLIEAESRSGDTLSTEIIDAEDADPTATVPTAESIDLITTGDGSYDESEMSEEDDPDQLGLDDEEMLALEEDDMTIDAFYEEFTDYMKSIHGEAHITDNGIDMIVMMETLVDWLGTRYLFGGVSESGIDCSAFTRMMCRENGIQIPRTAAAQWDAQGEPVEREELAFGDLIFFHTRAAVYVSHVGIYLGNDMFCHASSRNGVTVSSLTSNYYDTHYIGARRFDFTQVDREEPSARDAAEENQNGIDAAEVASNGGS